MTALMDFGFSLAERFDLPMMLSFIGVSAGANALSPFNALNHNNITAVNTTIYAISGSTLQFQDGLSGRTLFGLPTQSSNSILAQRQIQIGARLNF